MLLYQHFPTYSSISFSEYSLKESLASYDEQISTFETSLIKKNLVSLLGQPSLPVSLTLFDKSINAQWIIKNHLLKTISIVVYSSSSQNSIINHLEWSDLKEDDTLCLSVYSSNEISSHSLKEHLSRLRRIQKNPVIDKLNTNIFRLINL